MYGQGLEMYVAMSPHPHSCPFGEAGSAYQMTANNIGNHGLSRLDETLSFIPILLKLL